MTASSTQRACISRARTPRTLTSCCCQIYGRHRLGFVCRPRRRFLGRAGRRPRTLGTGDIGVFEAAHAARQTSQERTLPTHGRAVRPPDAAAHGAGPPRWRSALPRSAACSPRDRLSTRHLGGTAGTRELLMRFLRQTGGGKTLRSSGCSVARARVAGIVLAAETAAI